MNAVLKYLLLFVLGVVAVLLGLAMDRRLNPKPAPGGIAGSVTPCPKSHDITITDQGQGPQVAPITLSRKRADLVRWVNQTDKPFTLVFKPQATEATCPWEDGCIEIVVPPSKTTGFFRAANRTSEHGKSLTFNYYSSTTPLHGPPGEPGMTVED